MCIETFSVADIEDDRDAYEVTEFLCGNPHVREATCDVTEKTLVVDYDDDELCHESVLDEIEYAGWTPEERKKPGVIGRLMGK